MKMMSAKQSLIWWHQILFLYCRPQHPCRWIHVLIMNRPFKSFYRMSLYICMIVLYPRHTDLVVGSLCLSVQKHSEHCWNFNLAECNSPMRCVNVFHTDFSRNKKCWLDKVQGNCCFCCLKFHLQLHDHLVLLFQLQPLISQLFHAWIISWSICLHGAVGKRSKGATVMTEPGSTIVVL